MTAGIQRERDTGGAIRKGAETSADGSPRLVRVGRETGIVNVDGIAAANCRVGSEASVAACCECAIRAKRLAFTSGAGLS